MIQYTKEELISSTTISRNLSEILNNLSKKKIDKVAVMRNNKIEAIILPIDLYENIINNNDIIEHIELYNIIKQREKNPEYIDFDSILKESGLTIDDL